MVSLSFAVFYDFLAIFVSTDFIISAGNATESDRLKTYTEHKTRVRLRGKFILL